MSLSDDRAREAYEKRIRDLERALRDCADGLIEEVNAAGIEESEGPQPIFERHARYAEAAYVLLGQPLRRRS